MKYLKELYDELNQLKWMGEDEGWDLAINAVQKRIIEIIKVNKNDSEYKIMNFEEMSANGLVWKINKEVLHPLGLALARDGATSPGCIIAPDGKWEYSEESNIRNYKKFESFIKNKNKV